MGADTARCAGEHHASKPGRGLVYNSFPWPALRQAQGERGGSAQRARIGALGQAVLDARALPKNATSSLADLYDPNFMPAELRRAHRDLDAAVDKLYRARPFASDRERVEHLFPLYEKLVQPAAAAPAKNRRISRKTGIVTDVTGGVLGEP